MADQHFTLESAGGPIRFHVTTPTPVDGLCPTCMLPSMVRSDAVYLTVEGVTTFTTVTVCNDCESEGRA